MSQLIVSILMWILKKTAILVVLVALLVAGGWLASEWADYHKIQGELNQRARLANNLDEAISNVNRRLEETASETQRLKQKALKEYKLSHSLGDTVEKLEVEKEYWNSHPLRARLPWNWYKPETNAKLLSAARITAEKAKAVQANAKEVLDQSEGSRLIRQKSTLEETRSNLENQIEADREFVRTNPRQRLIAAVEKQVPAAFGILLGIICIPILIRAVFYFVFAPLAAKLPPVRILDSLRDSNMPIPTHSAVSLSIELGPGQEALLLPEYLQSCETSTKKVTRWFLNPRIPISSIASGLTMLTSIRSGTNQTTKVMASAQNDPLGELGLIELPVGSAMVIRPQSLVGVLKDTGSEIQISRHWRMGNLHSWLTLQLRFLVFHGPCKLIIKGCRGIVFEEPQRDSGRIINQDATIGFSANLDYRNTRCETFLSYLRGKETLFNNQFYGSPGLFVYEEMPRGKQKPGITGRGMEGVVDAALKIFGI